MLNKMVIAYATVLFYRCYLVLCNHILWGVGTLTQVKGLEGSRCSIYTTIRVSMVRHMHVLGSYYLKVRGPGPPGIPGSYASEFLM